LTGAAQVGAAAHRDAMLDAVLRVGADARAFAAGRVERHDVAQVDRRILLDPAALRIALRRPHVLPDAVDPFDDYAVLAGQDAQHLAALALVGAGNDDHGVAGFNVTSHKSQLLVASC